MADAVDHVEELDALKALEPVANGHLARSLIPPPPSSTINLQAVEYSKGELKEGDTLIYIKYPNDAKIMDPSGFELRPDHRVHSEKLLKTGSPIFKRMLEPLPQGRLRRRYGFVNGRPIPYNCQFILDLTPPDEGDEALELLYDLTCSPGVLAWHTSVKRLGVSTALAGGRDEFSVKDAVHDPRSPGKHHQASLAPDTTIIVGLSSDSGSDNGSDQDPTFRPLKKTEFARALAGSDTDAAFLQALKESKEDADRKMAEKALKPDEDTDDEDAMVLHDYDPIRHRAGIERLLRLIEGKSPRLDSAPKADYVTTWLFAEPNCKFIEILPEAAFRIGYALEIPSITYRAFAILVSEEAIRVGSTQMFDPLMSDIEKKTIYGDAITRYGRVRENIINEDLVNTIQHAGRAFAARIEHVFQDLVGAKLSWLEAIPEYRKLSRLWDYMKNSDAIALLHTLTISEFKAKLHDYIRGRLVSCMLQEMDTFQSRDSIAHRNAENWTSRSDKSFPTIYNEMGDYERYMCRFFWQNVRSQEWGVHCQTNLIRDPWVATNPWSAFSIDLADSLQIRKITTRELEGYRNEFNSTVIKSIQKYKYNSGQLPLESYPPEQAITASEVVLPASGTAKSQDMSSTAKLAFFDDYIFPTKSLLPAKPDKESNGLSLSALSAALTGFSHIDAIPPPDNRIPAESPYFSLTRFFTQVSSHVRSIATELLSRGECDFAELVDSLTCLTDNEYKYLPLWAGGMDDGTGGVFEEMIPLAERGGPVGPGPAYHTGSTVDSSWGGSEIGPEDSFSVIGTETETVGVNSSVRVEDGHRSHLDRREVVSEGDFPVSERNSVALSMTSKGTLGRTDDDHGGKVDAAADDDDDDDEFYMVEDEDEEEMEGDEEEIEADTYNE